MADQYCTYLQQKHLRQSDSPEAPVRKKERRITRLNNSIDQSTDTSTVDLIQNPERPKTSNEINQANRRFNIQVDSSAQQPRIEEQFPFPEDLHKRSQSLQNMPLPIPRSFHGYNIDNRLKKTKK